MSREEITFYHPHRPELADLNTACSITDLIDNGSLAITENTTATSLDLNTQIISQTLFNQGQPHLTLAVQAFADIACDLLEQGYTHTDILNAWQQHQKQLQPISAQKPKQYLF